MGVPPPHAAASFATNMKTDIFFTCFASDHLLSRDCYFYDPATRKELAANLAQDLQDAEMSTVTTKPTYESDIKQLLASRAIK